MSRRGRTWRAVGVVFALVNAVGAVWAFVGREWMHGGVHVALAGLTAYLLLRVKSDPTTPASAEELSSWTETPPVGADRMEQLQQSVDAIAIEVEPIGEAQRFDAKLRANRNEPTS